MDLTFNTALIQGYKSPAQIARRLTEDWLARNMYCPVCGETPCAAQKPMPRYNTQMFNMVFELPTLFIIYSFALVDLLLYS